MFDQPTGLEHLVVHLPGSAELVDPGHTVVATSDRFGLCVQVECRSCVSAQQHLDGLVSQTRHAVGRTRQIGAAGVTIELVQKPLAAFQDTVVQTVGSLERAGSEVAVERVVLSPQGTATSDGPLGDVKTDIGGQPRSIGATEPRDHRSDCRAPVGSRIGLASNLA